MYFRYVFLLWMVLSILGCNRPYVPRQNIDPLGKIVGTSGSLRSCQETYIAWEVEHVNFAQNIEDHNHSGVWQSYQNILRHLHVLTTRCEQRIAQPYGKQYESIWNDFQLGVPTRVLLRQCQQIQDNIQQALSNH